MADITYDFTIQADENPWVESGWVKATGSSNGRILSGRFTSVDSSNAVYLYDTQPIAIANKINVSVVIGEFTGDSSASRGMAIMAANGDGYFALIRSNDIRFYRTTPGGGANTLTQVGSTVSITAVDSDVFLFEYDVVNGDVVLKQNGVSRLTATDTTHIFTSGVLDPAKVSALRLGALSRSALGRLRSVTAYSFPASATITITDDLTPSEAFTGDCTGFADGAATLSFGGGATVSVTVSSDTFSGTLPAITDGGVYPKVPVTSGTVTLDQDALSASTTANITLPAGYQVLRTGDIPAGSPANFSGIIDTTNEWIGWWFEQNGTPLDTTKTCYWPNAAGTIEGGLWIYRDSSYSLPEAQAPLTTSFIIRDDDTNITTIHSITISETGVVVDAGGLSVAALSNSGLSNAGLSVSGL